MNNDVMTKDLEALKHENEQLKAENYALHEKIEDLLRQADVDRLVITKNKKVLIGVKSILDLITDE